MNKKQGFVLPLVLAILVIVAAGAVGVMYFQNKKVEVVQEPAVANEQTSATTEKLNVSSVSPEKPIQKDQTDEIHSNISSSLALIYRARPFTGIYNEKRKTTLATFDFSTGEEKALLTLDDKPYGLLGNDLVRNNKFVYEMPTCSVSESSQNDYGTRCHTALTVLDLKTLVSKVITNEQDTYVFSDDGSTVTYASYNQKDKKTSIYRDTLSQNKIEKVAEFPQRISWLIRASGAPENVVFFTAEDKLLYKLQKGLVSIVFTPQAPYGQSELRYTVSANQKIAIAQQGFVYCNACGEYDGPTVTKVVSLTNGATHAIGESPFERAYQSTFFDDQTLGFTDGSEYALYSLETGKKKEVLFSKKDTALDAITPNLKNFIVRTGNYSRTESTFQVLPQYPNTSLKIDNTSDADGRVLGWLSVEK